MGRVPQIWNLLRACGHRGLSNQRNHEAEAVKGAGANGREFALIQRMTYLSDAM